MKKIVILLFLTFSIISFGQDYKFGKVSKAELEEKFYPLDSTTDAAYLYKKRRTYFTFTPNKWFQLVTEVHERIKIYTKEGFDEATRTIPYYAPDIGDDERVSSIKGYTYYLNNGKIEKEKLSKNAIFKDKKNSYYSLKKITMPSIKEGCIIEIKYKINSPYIQNITDLEFQYGIPIKKLKIQIEAPEYFVFNQRSKGHYFAEMLKERKSGSIGSRRYIVNVFKFDESNIPALKGNEPFVSNIRNYRGGMKFELTQVDYTSIEGPLRTYSNSWEDVSKKVYQFSSFGGELKKSNFFKDDITSITATAANDFEKVVAIFQHVKSSVKWNDNRGVGAQKGIKKAYQEGVGNVADINLLLTAMLRKAGLNANPVLVSTRSNGIPFFPTIDGFNYVIAMVDFPDNTYALLDATAPYSAPNLLPKRTLNWQGRKVAKGGASSWVNLSSNKHALEENNIMISITEDMEIEGLMRSRYSNLKALNYRNENNHLKEEDVVKKIEEKYPVEIENFKVSNEQNVFKPISTSIKFNSEDLIEEINGKFYIEPLLFLTESKNPFKLEDRNFPVDFATPWKDKNTVSIQIPEGYKVSFIPESIAIGLPEKMAVFRYQITQIGNKINIISFLEFNQALIAPKYYQFLKDFYGKVVAKQSEKIVFEKE